MNEEKNKMSFQELTDKFNSFDVDSLIRLVPDFEEKLDRNDEIPYETLISALVVIKSLIFAGAYSIGKKTLEKIIDRFDFWKVDYSQEEDKDYFRVMCTLLGCVLDLRDYDRAYGLINKYGQKQIELFCQNHYFKTLLSLVYIHSRCASPEEVDLAKRYYFEIVLDEKCYSRLREYVALNIENSIDKSLFPEGFVEVQKKLLEESDPQLRLEYYICNAINTMSGQELLDTLVKYKNLIKPDHLILRRYTFAMIAQIDSNQLDFKEKIFLNFFHGSPYGDIHKKIIDEQKNQDNKIYVIRNESFEELSAESYLELLNKDSIDLVAGVIRSKGEISLLSDKRYKLLKNTIFYSVSGVGELTLTEKVFDEENLPFSTLLLRTRDLVTQLQKIGLPIVRENCRVKFDFDNLDVPIIISNDQEMAKGILWRLSLKYKSINRSCLKSELGVSQATANRQLKDWLDKGLICPATDSYGNYSLSI